MAGGPIRFRFDGRTLTAEAGETLLQAALRQDIEIPHLCYREGMRPDGNCRACMVEINGEPRLAAACCRVPEPDMEVASASDRARRAQRLVLDLLRAEVTGSGSAPQGGLALWSEWITARAEPAGNDRTRGPVARPSAATRKAFATDTSHPAITFDLEACILCTLCVRACREEQGNDVIGVAWRGAGSRICFDTGNPLGDSSCVGCGECVQVCPTGALRNAGEDAHATPDRTVTSVCPYCGVGCQLTWHLRDNRILRVEGRDGPANKGRLCVKGRYGFDYVHHHDRLTHPLIRRDDCPKDALGLPDEAGPDRAFRRATWAEAMERAAAGFRRILAQRGSHALAGFGSAKGSNEEAYLFQKLVRTGFGTNNVDHCTRLCHASSVAALLEMIGSGAVSNPVSDVADAEVIIVIGSNTTENHPVAATFMKNAARAGKTLIVMDPRRTPLARHARYFLQFRPDTDVALLNALAHIICAERWIDENFIATRTEGFEALRQHLESFAPERMAPVCGISAAVLHEVARCYATAGASMIFWGMGVSQHVHGTDNARCLINLALMTGQIGRPGTGLHPLRGQNNVQGASDAGLIPMVLPDYQRVDDDAVCRRFETLWNGALDRRPGLTVVETMNAIHAGDVRGMYIMGENPAMSDPDLRHAREALAALEHLVVQDIFMTETAWHADVVLPASAFPEKTGTFTNTDRRVQLGRQALDPPGEARQDLEILCDMAHRLGLDWHYDGPRDVFAEMRRAMPSIAGITWERLETDSAATYPCREEGAPGQPVIFTDEFPRAGGKGRFAPVPLTNADELPDSEYPLVLITGRQLEHWHTGAMTRRAAVLDALEPVPVVFMHPRTLENVDVAEGDAVHLFSRRGDVVAGSRSDPGLQPGQVFLPFCYREAAANLLTNAALDPVAKIPEFKFCAVRALPEPAGIPVRQRQS